MTATAKLMRRARRRHGLFLWEEAMALGVSPAELAAMVQAGIVDRWYRGVYAVAGAPDGWHRRVLAAHLAAGPTSLAAGLTAAFLLGIVDVRRPSSIELLVPRGRQPCVPVRLRDAIVLDPRERLLVRDVPTAVTPRALCQIMAGNADPDVHDRWFADAWRRGLTSPEHCLLWLGLVGRTPGCRRLREAVARAHPEVVHAASVAEIDGVLLLRHAGIDDFVVNLPVDVGGQRFVIDVAFVDVKLAVEIDSRRYHGILPDLARDEAKDEALRSDGWRVLRIPVVRLLRDAARVVADIRAARAEAAHDLLVAR